MTTSTRRSLVNACPALSSARCSASLRPLSRSRRRVSMAVAASWATASASVISDSCHSVGSQRCRPSTPITRSNATIGVASAPRVSRLVSSRTCPSAGSSSPDASSTSPTAIVRRSRAARFETGSRLGSSSRGTPGASHSAKIGIASPCSPRRMKQRSTFAALAVSSTVTWRSSSRSRRDRSASEIRAIRRSRSSASASARAVRVRSSASPASAASVCMSASSPCSKRRRSRIAANTTPTTSSRARTGTKAQLFTCAISFKRLFTSGDVSASNTAKPAPSRTTVPAPDASCSSAITSPTMRSDWSPLSWVATMRAVWPSSSTSASCARSRWKRSTSSARSARAISIWSSASSSWCESRSTPASSRSRSNERSSASRARRAPVTSRARSSQLRRIATPGTAARMIPARATNTSPPSGSRATRVSMPTTAAASPTHGKTSAVAKPISSVRRRSRQRTGASAAPTVR